MKRKRVKREGRTLEEVMSLKESKKKLWIRIIVIIMVAALILPGIYTVVISILSI